MNTPFEDESLLPFDRIKTSLRVTGYYAIMHQRLHEAFGDRVHFSQTKVPSHVTVSAGEYALSFTAALSARLLLLLGESERMNVALTSDADDILLTFSGVPQVPEAVHRSFAAYQTLFADVAEKGGFVSTLAGEGDALTITVTLRRTVGSPDAVHQGFVFPECEPFADALAYPI